MAAKRRTAKSDDVVTLYVSPDGKNKWSGELSEPNRNNTNGPLATIKAAQRKVRKLKGKKGLTKPVRVLIRGGTYFLQAPLTFAPADSGEPGTDKWHRGMHPAAPVTYAPYPGERVIISGGRRIDGFKETQVNGVDAWVADLPRVRDGSWSFRQLWVNGRRAERPKLPKEGLFRIEKVIDAKFEGTMWQTVFHGQDRFIYRKGDLDDFHNLEDVEFVALHFWIDTHRHFKRIDTKKRLAVLDGPSRMRLTDDHSKTPAQYYVANVFEALCDPGEWYLDRPAGKLYYVPRPGETIDDAEVIAPVLPEVMRLEGDTVDPDLSGDAKGKNAGRPLAGDRPVQCLRFEGLTFSHCEWTPSGEAERNATPQAACHVPGGVNVLNARVVDFVGCEFTHLGGYGVELAAGCSEVNFTGCDVTDVGAGGVKIWHGCRRNTVSDCEIADGGHLYHMGVGAVIGKASGNKLLHNHIHDFDYSGISVGWTWGYAESDAYGNIIEYNHVHDIGRGKLSDMGGIYTLGVSPGTRIRHNVFHDITSRGYGGWAIYTDEGSTDVLIENNLSYRTNCSGFHQHYGRDNLVRNNIFAFGGEAQVQRSRPEEHCSFLFVGNIVYADNDGKTVIGNWENDNAVMDRNLYFHASGKKMRFDGMTFRQWQKRGMDKHSIAADPKFKDPANGDFTLAKSSPAAEIGFREFDVSTVGPRAEMRKR